MIEKVKVVETREAVDKLTRTVQVHTGGQSSTAGAGHQGQRMCKGDCAACALIHTSAAPQILVDY